MRLCTPDVHFPKKSTAKFQSNSNFPLDKNHSISPGGKRKLGIDVFVHSGFPRRDHSLWVRIFCSTPIIAQKVMSDEPPAEMNGSGIPVIGAKPRVIATLMMT